jgi:hypothetical protein
MTTSPIGLIAVVAAIVVASIVVARACLPGLNAHSPLQSTQNVSIAPPLLAPDGTRRCTQRQIRQHRQRRNATPHEHALPPTFLFIAGLGGTGHHYWKTALQACPFCHDAPKIRRHLHAWWYSGHGSIDSTAQLLRAQASAPAPAPAPPLPSCNHGRDTVVWCLNVMREDNGTGMLSYPNNADRTHTPHVDWLMQAARVAGVRLRILLLTRHGPDLVTSVARRFGQFFALRWGGVDREHPVAAAMVVMADTLRKQAVTTLRLAPSLLACAAYEAMPEAAASLDRLLMLSLPSPLPAGRAPASDEDAAAASGAWTFAQHARVSWSPWKRTTTSSQPLLAPRRTARAHRTVMKAPHRQLTSHRTGSNHTPGIVRALPRGPASANVTLRLQMANEALVAEVCRARRGVPAGAGHPHVRRLASLPTARGGGLV